MHSSHSFTRPLISCHSLIQWSHVIDWSHVTHSSHVIHSCHIIQPCHRFIYLSGHFPIMFHLSFWSFSVMCMRIFLIFLLFCFLLVLQNATFFQENLWHYHMSLTDDMSFTHHTHSLIHWSHVIHSSNDDMSFTDHMSLTHHIHSLIHWSHVIHSIDHMSFTNRQATHAFEKHWKTRCFLNTYSKRSKKPGFYSVLQKRAFEVRQTTVIAEQRVLFKKHWKTRCVLNTFWKLSRIPGF